MTDRVLLGNRDGSQGLWVSKPGADVKTADQQDMLLSLDRKALQIVQNGAFSDPGEASTNITIPDLGFSPLVLLWCAKYRVEYTFPSATTLRITTSNRTGWPYSSLDGTVRYAVTNLPLLV